MGSQRVRHDRSNLAHSTPPIWYWSQNQHLWLDSSLLPCTNVSLNSSKTAEPFQAPVLAHGAVLPSTTEPQSVAETLQAFLSVLLFFLILGHFAPRGSTPRFLPSSPLSLPQSHFLIYFLWLFPSLDRAPLSISIIFQNSHWQQTLPFQPSGLEAAPLLHPTITGARQGR